MISSLSPATFLITVIIFSALPAGQCSEEYDNNLKDTYPDYGNTWMYIPDGEGNPQIANLTSSPPPDNQRFFFGDPEKTISYQLYTRDNKEKYSVLKLNTTESSNEVDDGDSHPFNESLFDPKKDVKILIHGWQSSGSSTTVVNMKDAYLENRDCNIIIVDWEYLASDLFYFRSAHRTRIVGNKTARMVEYLISEHGMVPEQFHIIGHSLGAHVSGYAGSFVRSGRISRITGLDPALPGFEYWAGPTNRLDEGDAQFVDVIHTCSGVLGYSAPLGHADFYPNGGKACQPGCEGLPEIIEACSHGRSHQFFVESIRYPHGYMARRCNSEGEVRDGSCSGPDTPMGDSVTPDTRGVFYTTTNSKEPYARNVEEDESYWRTLTNMIGR